MSDKHTTLGSPSLSAHSHLESHSDSSDEAEIPDTLDRVKFGKDTTSYASSGHWTSILDGVSTV